MSAERPDRSGRPDLDGTGYAFAVVCARFNATVTDALLEGATSALRLHGVGADAVEIYRVPGAFELPVVARRLCVTGAFDAVIALGAVIRGDTDHYELVAREAASGIARAGAETGVPVIFEVLATDTATQAMARAGGAAGNRGEDAALAAIETVAVLREIERRHPAPDSARQPAGN